MLAVQPCYYFIGFKLRSYEDNIFIYLMCYVCACGDSVLGNALCCMIARASAFTHHRMGNILLQRDSVRGRDFNQPKNRITLIRVMT